MKGKHESIWGCLYDLCLGTAKRHDNNHSAVPRKATALYVNSPEKGGIGRLRHPYIVRAPGS